MSAVKHSPATARIQSRLERWELDHLRVLVARQAAEIEELESRLRSAEDAADFWRESHHSLEAHLDDGTDDARCIGLTQQGDLLVVRTGGRSMSAAHTPGPWQAVEHYSDSASVVDANGFEIVEANDIAILLNYREKLGIEHWADSDKASIELGEEVQAANARLIAAAPELLEALRMFAEPEDPAAGCLTLSEATEARVRFYAERDRYARAAIAKASS